MNKTTKIIIISSIIGIIVIGVIIALLIITNNNNKTEKDKTDVSQSEMIFVDEVMNFAKAAETKYVSDSLTSTESIPTSVCYNISDLLGTYISGGDDYSGKIELTMSGDSITKSVTMTNKEYYVVNANPLSPDINVKSFSYDNWSKIDSECK